MNPENFSAKNSQKISEEKAIKIKRNKNPSFYQEKNTGI